MPTRNTVRTERWRRGAKSEKVNPVPARDHVHADCRIERSTEARAHWWRIDAPRATVGLIVGTYIHSRINDNGLLLGIGYSLLGGLFGFVVMFLLYKLGEIVARYRARKLVAAGQADDEEEALGGGDVYLAGVLGLMLGWDFIVLGLAWGVIFAGIVSILYLLVLLVRRRSSSDALMTFIPYGPFFIFAASLLLFQS